MSHADPEGAALCWRAELAGFCAIFVFVTSLLFLHWAVSPNSLGPADLDGRHGWFPRLLTLANWAGVGWGFLAVFALLGWSSIRLIWMALERVALRAAPDGLRMYGMFGEIVPWAKVEQISIERRGRHSGVAIVLTTPARSLFGPTRRRRHWITSLDLNAGAGEVFIAEALRWKANPHV